jgi:hypothetical protein
LRIDNVGSNFLLATDGVDGDDRALQIQYFQQFGNRGDLVGPAIPGEWRSKANNLQIVTINSSIVLRCA